VISGLDVLGEDVGAGVGTVVGRVDPLAGFGLPVLGADCVPGAGFADVGGWAGGVLSEAVVFSALSTPDVTAASASTRPCP
jgi:hypothetical protein